MASYFDMQTRGGFSDPYAVLYRDPNPPNMPKTPIGQRPTPPPGIKVAPSYLRPAPDSEKFMPGNGSVSSRIAAVPGFGIAPSRPGIPAPGSRFSDPVVGPGGTRTPRLSIDKTSEQGQGRGFGMNYNLGTMELFKNIQGMGGMERNEYLQSMRNNLMQRLARYDEIRQRGFGGEMGEDAMRDYRAIQQSLNDINKMMTDPAFMAQLQAAMTAGDLDARSVTLSAPSGNVNLSDFRRGAY